MKEKKAVFKRYVQNQPTLLPPSLDELVPERHPVRVVNEVLERIDIGALEASYKGGGASSYHPRMLLKVVVYAYLRNIYSSRKIEQACCENVHFMWLSGGAKPDHNTISDFRSKVAVLHLLPVVLIWPKQLSSSQGQMPHEVSLQAKKCERGKLLK